MRLFGFEIVRAGAPRNPPKRGDGALTEIMPPYGVNPPSSQMELSSGSGNLDERLIHNDPRDLFYLALPDLLTPRQTSMILRAALGGDLWQQWQLMTLMTDSWPMLRKCMDEVRRAVANVKFKVKPYVDKDGDEPSESAKEKADLVSRATRSFKPNAFTDEVGWNGFVYDMTEAWINGISMCELLWYRNDRLEMVPRAAAWIHPKHFTFGNDGYLAIFDDMYHRLTFQLAKSPGQSPNPNKFFCAQGKSRSGSSLGSGLIRPLAYYWSSMVWARQWKLGSAEKFGNPFLVGKYAVGMDNPQMQAFEQFLKNGAAAGYVMHPNTGEVEVVPPQNLGSDNRQVEIIREANEACQILLLGQVGTTTATPGKLGGQDGTHSAVKREVVEGVAKWIAELLTNQFSQAVINLNYPVGDQNEFPTIEADFTEPMDPLTAEQTLQAMLGAGMTLRADEAYRLVQMSPPDKGDMVVQKDKYGVLGEIPQDVGEPAPAPEPGQLPVGDKGFPAKPDKGVVASVRAALRNATTEQIAELKQLSEAALAAPHVNGEVALVRSRLKEIGETKR